MALVRKKAKAANLKRLWSARPSFPWVQLFCH